MQHQFKNHDIPTHAKMVRPFVVLGAMPKAVFPFAERVARLCWATGVPAIDAELILRRIDAVADLPKDVERGTQWCSGFTAATVLPAEPRYHRPTKSLLATVFF